MRQTISPELAKRWLEQNKGNRPLSPNTVAKYAAAMKRGEWVYNGEPIIFGDDDSLMSGQHRLHACIKAGATFDSEVIRGVPRSAFATLDTQRSRTAGDVLAISGEKNANKLGAAARAFFRLHNTHWDMRLVTTSQTIAVINQHPELRVWVNRVSPTGAARIFPSSFSAVLACIAIYAGQELAEIFFEKAACGIGLTDQDPERLLRDRFLSLGRGVHLGPEIALALMVRAANARITGKRLGVLRWGKTDEFPRIVGMANKAAA